MKIYPYKTKKPKVKVNKEGKKFKSLKFLIWRDNLKMLKPKFTCSGIRHAFHSFASSLAIVIIDILFYPCVIISMLNIIKFTG